MPRIDPTYLRSNYALDAQGDSAHGGLVVSLAADGQLSRVSLIRDGAQVASLEVAADRYFARTTAARASAATPCNDILAE